MNQENQSKHWKNLEEALLEFETGFQLERETQGEQMREEIRSKGDFLEGMH